MSRSTSAPPRGAADVSPETLLVLGLPSLDSLTDDQTRGATCVWGNEPLSTDMAVDLGEQMSPLKGTASRVRWTPRACPDCTVDRARRGRFAHAPTCGQCTDGADRCSVGQGLLNLLRRYGT